MWLTLILTLVFGFVPDVFSPGAGHHNTAAVSAAGSKPDAGPVPVNSDRGDTSTPTPALEPKPSWQEAIAASGVGHVPDSINADSSAGPTPIAATNTASSVHADGPEPATDSSNEPTQVASLVSAAGALRKVGPIYAADQGLATKSYGNHSTSAPGPAPAGGQTPDATSQVPTPALQPQAKPQQHRNKQQTQRKHQQQQQQQQQQHHAPTLVVRTLPAVVFSDAGHYHAADPESKHSIITKLLQALLWSAMLTGPLLLMLWPTPRQPQTKKHRERHPGLLMLFLWLILNPSPHTAQHSKHDFRPWPGDPALHQALTQSLAPRAQDMPQPPVAPWSPAGLG